MGIQLDINKYIGLEFGDFIILRFSHYVLNKSNRKIYFYECKCKCGNIENRELRIIQKHFKNNTASYCKICQKSKIVLYHENYLKNKNISDIDRKCSILFSHYKSKCKKKNIHFLINFNLFKQTVIKNCYYCNRCPMDWKMHYGKLKDRSYANICFNGIDRIDNNKGYIQNNIVSCCKDCNRAKLSLTEQEFYNLVILIYNNKELYNNGRIA